MNKKSIQIAWTEFANLGELPEEEQDLIRRAIEIAQKSYAPYSKFPVGAALLLDNGEAFAGNNQENIAYPSGTCAERTVLNYVHANFPDRKIKVIAITALKSEAPAPATPCGFCRQVLFEMEQSQQERIRVLLHKIGGATYAFDSTAALLPLAFEDRFLKG